MAKRSHTRITRKAKRRGKQSPLIDSRQPEQTRPPRDPKRKVNRDEPNR